MRMEKGSENRRLCGMEEMHLTSPEHSQLLVMLQPPEDQQLESRHLRVDQSPRASLCSHSQAEQQGHIQPGTA